MSELLSGLDSYVDLEVPPELGASLERHRMLLLELVRSLKVAGMSEAELESHVAVIVASYREELLNAMKAIAEVKHGGREANG